MTTFSSITDISDSVADIVSIDRPVGITSSEKQTDKELLALAHQVGEELNLRVEWPKQIKTVIVPGSSSSITLAPDFQRLVAGGAVSDLTGSASYIRGATSVDQWRLLTQSPSTQPYFFINGDSMLFIPDTPGGDAQYTYISDEWVLADAGTKRKFTMDDDKPQFPESLFVKGMVWRWRRNQGLEYADQLAEFEADMVTQIKAVRGITV